MKVRILLFSFLFFTGAAFSQESISLNIKNKPLKEVFSTIQKESGYRFFYNDDLIDINQGNSPYTNSMMNYLLIVGVKYHLTNRFSIIAQPTYKTNISSLFSSETNTSYNNFGLNVGLNYIIK